MDPRLKEILDNKAQHDKRLAEQNAKFIADQKALEQKAKEQDLAMAQVWIKENIFPFIQHQVIANKNAIRFSDHCWIYDAYPQSWYYKMGQLKIPAEMLAREAAKIDGLSLLMERVSELSNYEGPGWPEHYAYFITWSPVLAEATTSKDFNY